MKVLITNCAMRDRSGTEVATIDLAQGLSRRDHRVAVLAPLLGRSADILQNAGIAVADRPEELPWTPDVIHGHHNHVLAAALASFPDTPALFVSHSSNYWFDGPLRLSRVRRFCAVDAASRERVASELDCAIEAVDLLPNAVDLERFAPRAPLPAKPRRALLLAKNTNHIPAVRDAAADFGLELDEIGPAFGLVVDDLAHRLGQYDLVFATARMALEALAVGCAVIVVDGRGMAGLATSENVNEWRSNNFGSRLLTQQPSRDAIGGEIGRYDAQDAARASHRIRDVVSLSAHLDRVEAIHSEIVAAGQPPPDRANDLRELGAFIARWLCRLGEGIVPENFEVLSAANTAQRQFEAERLNYLQQIRVLNDACVDRLELINELSGQCEARLEVINKLDAALKLSDAERQELVGQMEVLAKKQADTIRRYGQVVRIGPFMLGISVES
jgi:Glycosyltransferase Family 4